MDSNMHNQKAHVYNVIWARYDDIDIAAALAISR